MKQNLTLLFIGMVCSSTALLQAAPVNDSFAGAIVFSGSNSYVFSTNTTATKEAGEPSHAGNAGGKSLWWRWTAPATRTVYVDTIRSTFDTLLAVYTGTSVGGLALVASDDDSGVDRTSRLSFNAVAGTQYSIAIDGRNGANGNVFLSIRPPPPSNDNFAQSTSITGTDVTVTGSNVGSVLEQGEPSHVTGNPFRSSVWWNWTAPVTGTVTVETAGSNFDTYLAAYTGSTISNLTQLASNDDFGALETSRITFNCTVGTIYRLVVGGFFYPTTGSITLRLTTQFVRPLNDDFANATMLSGFGVSQIVTNVNATKQTGEPNHAAVEGEQSVWWRWTAPASCLVEIDTIGSETDTTLAVYIGNSLQGLVAITSDDDNGGIGASRVFFQVTGNNQYRIVVDSKGEGGFVKLNLRQVETNTPPPINIAYKANWPGFRGGNVADIKTVGNLCYVSLRDNGILVLDVSDPEAPRRIGSIGLLASGSIAIADQYLYVGANDGIRVVDARNPTQPILVATVPSVSVRKVVCDEEFAYAITSFGLVIYDIRDPVRITAIATNAASYWDDIVLHGKRLLSVSWPPQSAFKIIDVSNPTTPTISAVMPLPDVPNFHPAIDTDGAYAYVANLSSLWIVDVSNPFQPALVKATQGGDGSLDVKPVIKVKNNVVYIGGNQCLTLVDVTQPLQPELISNYCIPESQRYLSDSTSAIDVANGYAYLGYNYVLRELGFRVINVSNASTSSIVSAFHSSHDLRRVRVLNNRVFAYNFPAGLQTFDINRSGDLQLTGTYPLPRSDQALATPEFQVRGSKAFVADRRDGFLSVDFAHPSQPVNLTNIVFPISSYLSFSRSSAYYISSSGGSIWITNFNISKPPYFALRWSMPVPKWESYGEGSGFRAPLIPHFARFVENEASTLGFVFDSGLKTYDASTPPTLSELDYFPTRVEAGIIGVFEGFAFLTNQQVTMFDVRQPSAIHPIGAIKTNQASGIAYWNNLVVVTDKDGLEVIDTSIPWNPQRVGFMPGPSFGEIALAGNLAIVAQGNQGLTILDLGAKFSRAPYFLDQPQSHRALQSSTVSFEIGANGNIPMTCQWMHNGTNILVGRTNFVLTLDGVTREQAGQYACVVSNAIGVTVSSNAVLEVDEPPVVTLESPAPGQVFLAPASVTLSATARDVETTGSVARVEFFVDGTLVAEQTSAPYSFVWSNAAVGGYTVWARATDNEGASSETIRATITVTNVQVFQLGATNYMTSETDGSVNVTVRRNTSASAASVRLRTFDGTAREVVAGRIGQYFGTNVVLNFATGESSKSVPIAVVNDLVHRGNREFIVGLSSPTPAGSWLLAQPTNAFVKIVDDDDTTNNFFPDVVGPTNSPVVGSLQITLSPSNALGRWRFWWEREWRASGSVASNLVAGAYEIEFLPRAGFGTPTNEVVTISTASRQTLSRAYSTNEVTAGMGGLRVVLLPDEVAAAVGTAARGQWRVPGAGDTNWQNSGAVLGGLPEGAHYVEFKSVTGDYETPVGQRATVLAGRDLTYEATYAAGPVPSVSGPRPVDSFNTITNGFASGALYEFMGQLATDAGFGSGVAVRKRAVLTAAHLVFDANTLSHVNSALWFWRRHRGENEPSPHVPRGWYVFSGYAAARTNDMLALGLSPQESSIESRNLDVAALYFQEDAARGGYSGFLTSGEGIDWLAGSRLKMLFGYPIENVPERNRGKMHEAGPVFGAFERVTNQVYQTDLMHSYGGNSGGPVCVLSTNSLGAPFFIPAGVYLGGFNETIARAIDIDVVDLINRAEASGFGGTNSSSGGVIQIRSSLAQHLDRALSITVAIGPAAAIERGGGWRVSPTNYGERGELRRYTNYQNGSLKFSVYSTNFSIEVKPLRGFIAPSNEPVVLTEGLSPQLDLNYAFDAPRLVYQRTNQTNLAVGFTGATGLRYRIESAPTLPMTNASLTTTNFITLGPGTNWLPTAPTGARSRFYHIYWLAD